MPRALSETFLNGNYRKFFDIPYYDASADQYMDVWLPAEGEGPFPTVLFFHGGAFRHGEKREDQAEPALRLLERGFAVADVEYRKSREARFPAMLFDAKAAVRFLRANAEKFSLDPARFAAFGPSAGGWIVSMLGLTAGNPAFEDLTMGNAGYSSAVQAVVDWCGPCGDFGKMDGDFEAGTVPNRDGHSHADSMESLFLGAAVCGVPELCRLASPYIYANADTPPFLILHGDRDETVPIGQSYRLCEAIRAAAGEDRVEMHVLTDTPHHSRVWNDDRRIAAYTENFLLKILGDKR